MTSSSAATRGAMFLPLLVAGATNASWVSISLATSGATFSASACAKAASSATWTLPTPAIFVAASRDAVDALAGDQQMDFAELRRGGDRGVGGVLDGRAVVLDPDQAVVLSVFERPSAPKIVHFATPMLQLATSSSTSATLTPAVRFAGSTTFSVVSRGDDVDAVVGGRLLRHRLGLRLHDVGQRGVARLVQAQVGGDDRGELQRVGLGAAVDLAGDARRCRPTPRPCEANVPWPQPVSAASIWPVWLLSSSIACLPRMTRPGCSSSQIALSSLATPSGSTFSSLVDQDRAVGAHRQRGAQRLLRSSARRSTPRRSRSRRPFPSGGWLPRPRSRRTGSCSS